MRRHGQIWSVCAVSCALSTLLRLTSCASCACWQSFLRSFQRPCAPLTLQRGAMHADGTRVKKEDNQCSATIEVIVGLAV